jgi:hypothetical protein
MSLWDEPVRDVRPLATEERQHLLHLIAGITDEQWLAPTSAPGWTVKDTALHLLDDDLTWLSRERDGDLSGLVDMSDRRAFPRLLAEKNQRWVEAGRVMSRRVIADLLQWSGEQVDELHAGRDLLAEGWVSWASDDAVPFWFNLAQEFTERWVHQQQMREAVDRVEHHEATLPEVLRTFIWAFPHQLRGCTRASEIEIEIVIDAVGDWTLTATNDSWQLFSQPASDPDARLRMTADAAWRMLTGAEVVLAADIAAEGDPAMTRALLGVRAIVV